MKTDNTVRIFLGGDVFGSIGLRSITRFLPELIQKEKIDFSIINGENTSAGVGISENDVRTILSAGADVITGGNHTFEKRDYWPVLNTFTEVIRPANFPAGSTTLETELPGRGSVVLEKKGIRFAVLNLQGREDMSPIDCPFRIADAHISTWLAESEPPLILVDFHAESNAEKEALGLYLAGRVASVTGTHTHVQTADERILPGGTAYMTDIGMTGPLRSVIGGDPEMAVKRNVTQILYKMDIPDGPGALRGLIVDVDRSSKKAVAVKRIEILEST